MTTEERVWLEEHPVVHVAASSDWPPFEFKDAKGNYTGYAIDIFSLAAKRAGLKFETSFNTRQNLLDKVKNRKLDVIPILAQTTDRDKYLVFTRPVFTSQEAIWLRKTNEIIQQIADLDGKTVSVEDGYSTHDLLASKYPNIKLLLKSSKLEAIQAVSSGQADAYIGNQAVTAFLMKENVITNLKNVGFLKEAATPLMIGVRADMPLLRDILDKGLATITTAEKNEMLGRYVNIADLKLKDHRIVLTPEEQIWLNDHPVIRVHNEWSCPPFNFNTNGKPDGLSIDYMNLLAYRIGIKVKYIPGEWGDLLGQTYDKKLDVMLNIVKTPERQKHLIYTKGYIKNPNIILGKEESFFSDIESLFGKKVAYPEGFFYDEVLRNSFPKIIRVPMKDTLATLMAMQYGQVDAVLAELAVAEYLIRENLLTGIVIKGPFNAGSFEYDKLNIAVRDDWPILATILDKALVSITPEERRQIQLKWLGESQTTDKGLVFSEQTKTKDESYIALYIVGVILVFTLLLVVMLALPRFYSDEDLARHFGSTRFREVVLAVTSLMAILVAGLVWRVLLQNKNFVLNDTRSDLKIVLQGTIERLDSWVHERQTYLLRLGQDPELVAITKRLLEMPTGVESLKHSLPLSEARAFFAKNEAEFGVIGFFIINKDRISIGSRRDSNLGMKNLIAEQKERLLARAFQGEAVFIPPIRSDIYIPAQNSSSLSKPKKQRSMFFAVPIIDLDGSVLAVLTQRLQPEGKLSKILQSGRIGHSGESYLVNNEGLLLTESRFKEQLFALGLLKRTESEYEQIEIRDPGCNMMEGGNPEFSKSERSYTRMAKDLIRISQNRALKDSEGGHSHSEIIVDVEGYRDYRGVPVFGAWAWDNLLGLGVGTKIDVDEVLGGFNSMRQSLLLITGVTLFLTITALLLSLMLGERVTRTIRRTRDELEIRVNNRTSLLQQEISERKLAEEGLRKLTRAVEGNPMAIIITNLQGIIEYVNPKFTDMTGYKSDEAIGQTSRILDSGEHKPEIFQELWKNILAGNEWHGEFLNKRKTGENQWQSAIIAPIIDENNKITHFVSIQEDTTQRKQLETEMRQNIDELERFESMAIGREKQMIKLKEEINELLKKLGQENTYKIVK